MKKCFFLLLTLCLSTLAIAQKGVTAFGISVKPIIPSSYFRTGTKDYYDGDIKFSIAQNAGFSAGGLIRKCFTNTFALETGIMFSKRNYSLSITDTTFVGKSDFKVIAYEIPISAIVFVQLDKKLFMSSAFGMSLDILPSDIYTFDYEDPYYKQYSAYNQKVNGALNVNLGAEYRTVKSGSIYVGFCYHRSFSYLFNTIVEYYPQRDYLMQAEAMVHTSLVGDYFTLDFRYYFHEDPEKKKRKK